ncbi:MAG: 8-amino-7-oxononanoate synthase, partial [Psychrobacter celer]
LLSTELSEAIALKYSTSAVSSAYTSPIVPYILGDNARTLTKAQQLQAAGFYALPIRPPTVPANSARIRLVMNAKLTYDDCERLIQQL